jgi:hypothetical protein
MQRGAIFVVEVVVTIGGEGLPGSRFPLRGVT